MSINNNISCYWRNIFECAEGLSGVSRDNITSNLCVSSSPQVIPGSQGAALSLSLSPTSTTTPLSSNSLVTSLASARISRPLPRSHRSRPVMATRVITQRSGINRHGHCHIIRMLLISILSILIRADSVTKINRII